MTTATYEQFESLWRELGCEGQAEDVFRVLAREYSHPSRHYHTLEHVGWGLERIDELLTRLSLAEHKVPNQLRWAMWFHDARMTFDPIKGKDDEKRSAALAEGCAIAAGIERGWAYEVASLIESTTHLGSHFRDYASGHEILNDADVSILGADETAFDEYEIRIRAEWKHIPEADFRFGRLKVLQRFADMGTIFQTAYGRSRWEENARSNIARSMRKLVGL